MIVAANIGVVDEVELVERQVRHLQAIGVDRIVYTDTGSSDGTAEILQGFADRGEIVLLRASHADPDAFDYANRMLEFTLNEIRPDWILFGDADEFHIPRTGRIHDVVANAATDVLRVERYNVPVDAQGPLWPADLGPAGHDRLQLIVRQIPALRERLVDDPATPWILGRIVPKVMARAGAVGAGIRMGAHAPLSAGGRPATRSIPTDLLIAHVPVTTRARFLRKLANIRQVFARVGDRFGPQDAWHWRRWMELDDAGRADEEFERQVFAADQLAALRAAGTVMSAAQWFAAPLIAEPPK